MTRVDTLLVDDVEVGEKKKAAIGLIDRAWSSADDAGIEPEIMSHAALFAALATLVSIYGETAVAELATNLPGKVRGGQYTLDRTLQ